MLSVKNGLKLSKTVNLSCCNYDNYIIGVFMKNNSFLNKFNTNADRDEEYILKVNTITGMYKKLLYFFPSLDGGFAMYKKGCLVSKDECFSRDIMNIWELMRKIDRESDTIKDLKISDETTSNFAWANAFMGYLVSPILERQEYIFGLMENNYVRPTKNNNVLSEFCGDASDSSTIFEARFNRELESLIEERFDNENKDFIETGNFDEVVSKRKEYLYSEIEKMISYPDELKALTEKNGIRDFYNILNEIVYLIIRMDRAIKLYLGHRILLTDTIREGLNGLKDYYSIANFFKKESEIFDFEMFIHFNSNKEYGLEYIEQQSTQYQELVNKSLFQLGESSSKII